VLFRGEHETSYRYSRPVFLEPHLVRLAPLGIASQRLEAFALEVFPAPAGRCDILDPRGNPATRLWFHGLPEALTVNPLSFFPFSEPPGGKPGDRWRMGGLPKVFIQVIFEGGREIYLHLRGVAVFICHFRCFFHGLTSNAISP